MYGEPSSRWAVSKHFFLSLKYLGLFSNGELHLEISEFDDNFSWALLALQSDADCGLDVFHIKVHFQFFREQLANHIFGVLVPPFRDSSYMNITLRRKPLDLHQFLML